MFGNQNKKNAYENTTPSAQLEEQSHNTDPGVEIDVFVKKADEILIHARDIRRAFLRDGLAKGLTEKEIIQAAMEAFNARQLPRIAFGERGRGSGYVVAALFGKDIPGGEVNASISKDEDGNPVSLVFDADEMAYLPGRTEVDSDDDYHAHMVLMPQVDPVKGTSEDWQEHVANLQKALFTEQ